MLDVQCTVHGSLEHALKHLNRFCTFLPIWNKMSQFKDEIIVKDFSNRSQKKLVQAD